MSTSPLVLLPCGRKSQELTALDKKSNWIGFLRVRYFCRTHHIEESLRIPVFQAGPSSTRWRRLRKPFFRIYCKETKKCRIFQKALLDERVLEVAMKQAVDYMFGAMRQETTLDGYIKAWFESRDAKIQYCVERGGDED